MPDYNWIKNGTSLLRKENTVAVSGAYLYYDADMFIKFVSLFTQLTIFKLVNFIIQKKEKGAILIGGNIFVSAYLLEGIGGFNTNLTFYGDDIDLAIKLSKFGNVKFSSALTIKTSARRFKALGFYKVNKKFKDLILGKHITQQQSLELFHPR